MYWMYSVFANSDIQYFKGSMTSGLASDNIEYDLGCQQSSNAIDKESPPSIFTTLFLCLT